MINIPKGTKDVLPQESYKWQYVEAAARETCRLFGAHEIRTPVFEHTELFLRSIGEETDVVSKEMYTFLDKGERSITLKAEGTAPVARSFVENSLDFTGLPLKMFYFTPVFRYERPQAGRLREHHQFGVEMYGGKGAEYDYEVIALAYKFLFDFGITDLALNINSIGCEKCRGGYNDALKKYLTENKAQLCPTCIERMDKNPLRTLDCKVDSCKKIVENAPKILDYICDDCSGHMEKLKSLLTRANIPFVINPNIVRGLDYYTKTVFEFVTNALGAQGTVCGGGRYDNLVESVGGKPTPCVGFGMGIERLLMLADAMGIKIEDKTGLQVCVISQSAAQIDECTNIVASLRKAGVAAETDYMGRSLKAQFKYADKNSKYAIVIGESELQSGIARLKRLSDGEQVTCKIEEISKFVL